MTVKQKDGTSGDESSAGASGSLVAPPSSLSLPLLSLLPFLNLLAFRSNSFGQPVLWKKRFAQFAISKPKGYFMALIALTVSRKCYLKFLGIFFSQSSSFFLQLLLVKIIHD